jgi:hypothetical protein
MKTENVDQLLRETHADHVDAGGANEWPKPTPATPRPSKRRHAKAASPASCQAKPNAIAPGSSLRDSHCLLETHAADAVASPAKAASKPKSPTPGSSNRRRQSQPETQVEAAAATGRANQAPKPNGATPGHLSNDSQTLSETQTIRAVVSHHNQVEGEIHAISVVVGPIRELWRRRQAWHRAEKSLTLQCCAICRRSVGGDRDEAGKLLAQIEKSTATDEAAILSCLPLLTARAGLERERKAIEKALTSLAASLPVAPWVEGVRGFGMLSLAGVVGECGDVGSYKSVSAVWKRFGLAVVNGGRQRRVTGPDAIEHGYSPSRRSVAWNLGTSLMRAQKASDPYRQFYDREKERQAAKDRPVKNDAGQVEGEPALVSEDGKLSKGHAHNRACRHMTKRLLADFYGEWRRAATSHWAKPRNNSLPPTLIAAE